MKINDRIRIASSDEKGRKLVVQVVDDGEVINASGVSLNLYWETRTAEHKGLDAFDVVDASKGIFELYFTTGMLSNKGKLNANLQLVDTTGTVTSEGFPIDVFTGVDNEAMESQDSFTTMTEAMVRLNNKRDRNELITNEDLSQEVKEQMTGGSVAVVGKNSVLNENIVDGQISPSKLSFYSQGVNKFNGDFKQVSMLDDGNFKIDLTSYSAIIPIVAGQTYHFRKNNGNRLRLGFHKSNPIPTGVSTLIDYYIGDITPGVGYQAPVDATHLLLTVSFNQGLPEIDLQITEGSDQPYFVGYDFLSQKNVKGLEPLLKELSYSRNISFFNVKPMIDLKYDSTEWFEGAKIHENVRLFYNLKREFIQNDGEYVNAPTREENDRWYYIYVAIDTQTMELKVGKLSYQTQTFPEHYHLIAIVNPIKVEFYGLKSDEVTINGEPYVGQEVINKIDEKIDDIDIEVEPQTKYYFLEDLNGVYDKPDDIPDGSSGTELDLINSNHSVIYDVYDNLLAKYPNYVSSRVIGQDSNGLDIHEYSFTAPRIGNSNNFHINVPKIIMISAIHGYEQGSAYSTAMFFKDLAENWQTKEQLEFLRWNVDFVIIPVANPDGYDNNRRINYNGVDPNRNFWEGTRTTGTPGDDYFGGFEGMAEPEVKAIAKMIDENLDADFYIDYHNISGGYPMAYTYGDIDRTLMNSLYRSLSKKWAKDYPEAPQDGTMMGYISGPIANASVTYASKQGIKSTLLETPWKMPFANAKYDKITLETGTETLGNLIVAIVKSLK